MGSAQLARVIRSDLEESVHEGDIAVVDRDGRLVLAAGDPGRVLFARSSMKPLQAAVSLSMLAFDPPDQEVAVMCASHNAESVHVEAVRSLLARAGVPETALRCPAFRPWDEETAVQNPERRPINSDCSGKHAGMLAACAAMGWPLDSYRDPDHPLQRSVSRWVTAASGVEPVAIGVDGCGVPVHALPLRAMAALYARLAFPDGLEELRPFVIRAVSAMRAQPYFVAGRNRVDTAVMEVAPDVVVKSGAEALICAALIDRGMGVAIKVRDGSARAAGPALIRGLRLMGVLGGDQSDRLEPFAHPPVLGGGEPVGRIEAMFDLNPR